MSRRVLVASVLVPTALALGHILCNSVLPQVIPKWNATARQRTILYSADHAAIRDSARELINSADPSDVRAVDKLWGTAPDWERAPEAVRAIKPTSVSLWGHEEVRINCGSLDRSYGIEVFAPEAQQSGTKQLIDGVWYFDSENQIPEPAK